MNDAIEFMCNAFQSMGKAGKILIEKKENDLSVKVSVTSEDSILLGMMFMEAMEAIRKRSKKHEFSIASACEQVLDEIRKEADHE